MLPAGAARCPLSLLAEAARWCWEGVRTIQSTLQEKAGYCPAWTLHLDIDLNAENAEEANAEATEDCVSFRAEARRAAGARGASRGLRSQLCLSVFSVRLSAYSVFGLLAGRPQSFPQRQRTAPAGSDSRQHAAPAGSIQHQPQRPVWDWRWRFLYTIMAHRARWPVFFRRFS